MPAFVRSRRSVWSFCVWSFHMWLGRRARWSGLALLCLLLHTLLIGLHTLLRLR